MRVALTRPRDQALPVARALNQAGVETLIEPLLTIVPRAGVGVGLDGVQAILLTSANGARALAAATSRRDVPIYAVGETSAATARAAGFGAVRSADSDVDGLAALAAAHMRPEDGALIHVCGSTVAGDLTGALAARGFMARSAVLYDAVPVEGLSAAFCERIKAGEVAGVLFYSPRTATQFVDLAERAELSGAITALTAYCLSAAVAEAVGRLTWARIAVGPRPNGAALIDLVVADGRRASNMSGE